MDTGSGPDSERRQALDLRWMPKAGCSTEPGKQRALEKKMRQPEMILGTKPAEKDKVAWRERPLGQVRQERQVGPHAPNPHQVPNIRAPSRAI